MSRKNHKMIDGRLLQTNKKYSQLKMKQKEKIAEWMFQATRDYYMKKCTFPSDKHLEEVVDSVYEKIEDAEIWIPYGEAVSYTHLDVYKRQRRLSAAGSCFRLSRLRLLVYDVKMCIRDRFLFLPRKFTLFVLGLSLFL